MTLRFDHAVIATRDLAGAIATYRQLGFVVEPGGRHTGKGTRNALVRFPSDYLELIAIDDRDEALAAGPSRVALVRYLERAAGGLSTFALRTSTSAELDALVGRWGAAGLATGAPNPAERVRPDGSVLRWRTAVPGGSSVRETWPFVIDWPDGALPGAPAGDLHPNGASGVVEVAVLGSGLDLFNWYDTFGLPPVGRPDDAGLGATRAVVRLPGCEIDLLVPTDGSPLAGRLHQEGPGPMQVAVLTRDLDALEDLLRARGLRTTPAWPTGVRIADPDPAVAPLVFLPAEAAPRADAPADGGLA